MSGKLIVDNIQPDNPIQEVQIDGNINANGHEITNYMGFPKADFDSGWMVKSGNSAIMNISHNLFTRDFAHVAVEGSTDAVGTYPLWVSGVTSSGGGQYGFAVRAVSDNSIEVMTYSNGGMYTQQYGECSYFRVRLWKA